MLDFMFSRKAKQPQRIDNYQTDTLAGDYIVFDIETSGFNPELHKIIEIGAIKVVNGKTIDSYHSLISYKGRLNQEIVNLTGIDPSDLKDAPERKTVLSEFFDFVGDYNLVGHNITQFDNKFLWFSAISVGLTPKKNGLIDTLTIARQVLASDSYKLDYLCTTLGIGIDNTHRALDDANLTLMLFKKLNEQFPINITPELVEYQSTSQYGQRIDTKYMARNGDADIKGIAGKKFCVTTFQPFHTFKTEGDLQQFIIDGGGEVGNLTRTTDYLIDCDPVYVSSKETKALEYIKQGKSDVKIISPNEFLELAGL